MLRSDDVLDVSTPLFILTRPPPPLADCLRDAERANPALASLDAKTEVASQGVVIAKSEFLPSVGGFADDELIKNYLTLTEPNWNVGIGIGISFKQQNANAARAQLDAALSGARPEEKQAAQARARQAAGGVAEVGAAADEVQVKAPVNGEVETVVLLVGELAPAGVPIMTVVDLSDIWAVFNVREDEFSGIAMGAELQATVPALANRKIALKINFISPRGDYATWRATRQTSGFDIRTFEVRARPVQPVDGLRPGMTVLVDR